MSKSDLQAHIKKAHKQGHTGVLRVRASDWPEHDLYFMGGELIACGSPDDRSELGALLVAAAAVSPDVLLAVHDSLEEGQDLADELVMHGGVAGDAVMAARAHLFADNLAWASVAPAPDLTFESQDAVFPPNMQFGLVLDDALAELKAWSRSAGPTLKVLHDGLLYAASGDAPDDVAPDLWEALQTPSTLPALIATLGPPRRDAAIRAAGLLKAKRLLFVDEGSDGETDAADPGDSAIEVEPPAFQHAALDLAEPEFLTEAEDDEELSGDPEDLAAPADEPAAAHEPTGDEQITEEDYERAARGEFIKSYDVLDKVDLSGVKVLGAEKQAEQDESLPAIEAIGDEYDEDESAIELGDMDSMDGIAALADEDLADAGFGPTDTRPEVAPVSATSDDIELMSDDFAMFDMGDGAPAPPVQEVEIAFDADDDVLSEEPLAAVVLDEDEDAGATGTFNVGEEVGVFDREQLNDFHHRIDVFNNIFRIIFRSFSEHIGPEKSQQRFNALLSSSQRQYPELFENLAVDADGSILAAPLVNNLSNCPPGDYGSLLHQGLYELIFSHLYNAKDMLPGNAETEMMEQIVVFERQLHQM